jgi:hypothetical protein
MKLTKTIERQRMDLIEIEQLETSLTYSLPPTATALTVGVEESAPVETVASPAD